MNYKRLLFKNQNAACCKHMNFYVNILCYKKRTMYVNVIFHYKNCCFCKLQRNKI